MIHGYTSLWSREFEKKLINSGAFIFLRASSHHPSPEKQSKSSCNQNKSLPLFYLFSSLYFYLSLYFFKFSGRNFLSYFIMRLWRVEAVTFPFIFVVAPPEALVLCLMTVFRTYSVNELAFFICGYHSP